MKKTITILTLLLLLASCSTKKKITSRNLKKTDRTEKTASTVNEESQIKTDSSAFKVSEVIKTGLNESIRVVSANDSTPIEVKRKVEGNVSFWKVSGAKTLKIENEAVQETKTDSSQVKVQKLESNKANTTTETEVDESSVDRSRESDSDAKRMPFGISLFIILLILALLIYVIRKAYKDLKGLGRVSNWF